MPGDIVELDIAVIVDGRIIVGEAKSNGKLGDGKKNLINSAKLLVAAAKTLSADEIVIATATSSWTSGTREAVEASINAGWASGPQPTVTETTGVGAHGHSAPGDKAQHQGPALTRSPLLYPLSCGRSLATAKGTACPGLMLTAGL
jgi:hypothetical protein